MASRVDRLGTMIAGGLGAGAGVGVSAGSSSPARPARRPITKHSLRELEASRLAPCRPVHADSPIAYRPGTVVPPSRSATMPPMT